MKRLIIVILCVCLVSVSHAQDNCPVLVDNTLDTLDSICDATSRDELCYGNTSVAVTSATGAALPFAEPGDIVSIVDVATISTSPFAEPDEWGIALMKVQANIPDSLPGQQVTFLLFGQVDVRSADTNANGAPEYAPMQAFYFEAGIGENACNAVPRDGILIQTPDYEGQVELVINDVEIALGSTVYLQAEAGALMTVVVIEGFAVVTANGETVTVRAGAFTEIEINDTLNATGTPTTPQPYDTPDVTEALQGLLDAYNGESSGDIIDVVNGQQWCVRHAHDLENCAVTTYITYDAEAQTIQSGGGRIYVHESGNRYSFTFERERREWNGEAIVTLTETITDYFVVISPEFIERHRTFRNSATERQIDHITLIVDD